MALQGIKKFFMNQGRSSPYFEYWECLIFIIFKSVKLVNIFVTVMYTFLSQALLWIVKANRHISINGNVKIKFCYYYKNQALTKVVAKHITLLHYCINNKMIIIIIIIQRFIWHHFQELNGAFRYICNKKKIKEIVVILKMEYI